MEPIKDDKYVPNTFTPGPWKVRAGTFCKDDIPSYEVVMQGRPTLNAVDARLIGKAPELHRQLTDMCERFERCAIHAGSDAEFVRAATAEARAVLDLSYKPE